MESFKSLFSRTAPQKGSEITKKEDPIKKNNSINQSHQNLIKKKQIKKIKYQN